MWRKNRKINRGERSKVFYARYKYLLKCGSKTWNTHEVKDGWGNIVSVRFLQACTTNKVFVKSFSLDGIKTGRAEY